MNNEMPTQDGATGANEITAIDVVKAALESGDLARATQIARAMAEANPPAWQGLIEVVQKMSLSPVRHEPLRLLEQYAGRFAADPLFNWFMAQAYAACYMHGKAEPHLRMVAAAAPDDPEVQFTMGRNLFRAGRQDEASPYLERANNLRPNHAKTLYFLGQIYEQRGEYADALTLMRRSLELTPDDLYTRQHVTELERIVEAPPPRNTFARWPQAASEFNDVRALVNEYVIKGYDTRGFRLKPGMGVFTQGSCFAGNLAISLRRYNLNVGTMECSENHNGTYANRAVVDWLLYGVTDERTEIAEETLGRDQREQYLVQIRTASLFVYTMGVAPAHFDRETGVFLMSRGANLSKAAMFRRSVFRTTTVQENVDNLLYIMNAVREISPSVTCLLTVSPVPLNATNEFKSAIVADCVSKSTLRVAVNEVINKNLPGVLYWPSFEMVRWLGGHIGRVFGNDDGSTHHPDISLINTIMDSFIDTFGDDALRATKKA